MTVTTTATLVAADSLGTDEGLEARAEGITASEIHAIHTGGRSTWRRILADKLNGSTFRGNMHTRRGHEREPFILAGMVGIKGIASLEPNVALYANAAHPLHRATPDALGALDDGTPIGGEVKSRAHGWDVETVPTDVLYQCQWGMHTLGYDHWALGTEVMGADGEPTLDDPHVVVIDRDQALIDALARSADEFLVWRESGAPDDTLPDDELDVVRRWTAATARKNAAEKEVKALRPQVDKIIAAHPTASTKGWRFANETAGGFTYSVKHEDEVVLDEEAWQKADPEGFAEVQRMREVIAEAAAAAAERYSKTVTNTTTRLTPVQPKGTAR